MPSPQRPVHALFGKGGGHHDPPPLDRPYWDLYCARWQDSRAWEYLMDLRRRIGDSNYQLGLMPSPILP